MTVKKREKEELAMRDIEDLYKEVLILLERIEKVKEEFPELKTEELSRRFAKENDLGKDLKIIALF